MENQNGNMGAFACASSEGHQQGLTKREYIACMAMQGILSKHTLSSPNDQGTIAQLSIEIADELLKQLK